MYMGALVKSEGFGMEMIGVERVGFKSYKSVESFWGLQVDCDQKVSLRVLWALMGS